MPHILLLALLSMPILTAHAAQYSSGDQRVIAVELFTSQGCSSCPPADRRLSRLKDHPLLWKRFVPMAWHVDYWDYLGWRDPYADSANSRRQTDYRRAGATKVVYTPGFFRDGKEWRSWYGEPVADEEKNALGRLTLNVEGGTATLQLDTPVDMQAKGLLGHIAILGFDLATPVERGENRGEMLHEDFVVLFHRSGYGDGTSWQIDLDTPDLPGRKHALVGWLSRGSDPRPLQATGGWWQSD